MQVESNSRFVIWDDGSMQLLIGEESFDVSEQDIHDMQTHLFSVHDKVPYQLLSSKCIKLMVSVAL